VLVESMCMVVSGGMYREFQIGTRY